MPETPDFDTDAALNAALDGELDAFARDHATDTPSMQAELARRPGTDERRRELQAVRASVAAPIPPLDELTRARLLAGASAPTPQRDTVTAAATRRSGMQSWVPRAAAAAVVVLALVGGGMWLAATDSSTGSASKSATSGAGNTRSVASGDLGDLGELSRDQLDRLIGGPKSGVALPKPLGAGAATDAASSPEAQSPTPAAGSTQERASKSERAVTPGQLATCRDEYERLGAIQFAATGTFQAQPAIVLGIKRASRVIVFVLAADNCSRVLLSVSR